MDKSRLVKSSKVWRIARIKKYIHKCLQVLDVDKLLLSFSMDPMAHVKHEANLLLIMFCNGKNVQQSDYKG